MTQIMELMEKRAKAWEAAKAFLNSHSQNGGMVSAEDAATYDKMEKEVTDLTRDIERLQRQEQIDKMMSAPTSAPLTGKPGAKDEPEDKPGRASAAYKKAFWDNIRHPGNPMIRDVLEEGTDANGGYLVTPYVVDSISDKDGNIISQTETNIRRQVISEEVSRQLLAMMENNVHGAGNYHSCANAYVAGYRIGGKSGTAERTDRHLRGDGDYYKMMSFAAVLPIDDPEIEVFVLLDDPRWVKDYASQVVAPVVGNIISEIAPYLGIEQDADYNPTGTVTVQTCLDYTWTNAQVTLNRLGLKHKLIGPSSGNIVYQYPVGGSVVPAGSTIYLYTATDQNSMTTTPDVVGKTGTFAEQMLKAANLNVQFAGDSSGKVVAQDVEAGTSAAYGTIITLTMDSGEDTTNDAPTVTEEIDPANEEG